MRVDRIDGRAGRRPRSHPRAPRRLTFARVNSLEHVRAAAPKALSRYSPGVPVGAGDVLEHSEVRPDDEEVHRRSWLTTTSPSAAPELVSLSGT